MNVDEEKGMCKYLSRRRSLVFAYLHDQKAGVYVHMYLKKKKLWVISAETVPRSIFSTLLTSTGKMLELLKCIFMQRPVAISHKSHVPTP